MLRTLWAEQKYGKKTKMCAEVFQSARSLRDSVTFYRATRRWALLLVVNSAADWSSFICMSISQISTSQQCSLCPQTQKCQKSCHSLMSWAVLINSQLAVRKLHMVKLKYVKSQMSTTVLIDFLFPQATDIKEAVVHFMVCPCPFSPSA